jgi:hypothetical protein
LSRALFNHRFDAACVFAFLFILGFNWQAIYIDRTSAATTTKKGAGLIIRLFRL